MLSKYEDRLKVSRTIESDVDSDEEEDYGESDLESDADHAVELDDNRVSISQDTLTLLTAGCRSLSGTMIQCR